jgi:DNA-binding MarR family transcriptional regulator
MSVKNATKLLFFILIFILAFSFPFVNAEDPKETEPNEILDRENAEGDPERPTAFPDLSISSDDISIRFENIEDEFIMIIQAKITNNGFVGAMATVEFYNSTIDFGNKIGSDSFLIRRRDVHEITHYWKVDYGKYKIYVLIRDSVPREIVKWNNAADAEAEFSDPSNEGGGGGFVEEDKTDDSMGLANIPLDNPAVTTGFAATSLLVLFVIANKHYMWISGLGTLPLYSRITNGQVLKQDTRKNIYEYIESNPGVYFSSIMKVLKLKNGVTSYHLSMLEREGYIKSKNEGLYKRFYADGASTQEIPLSQLRRSIVTTIVDNPGISQTDIAFKLGLSNQVVNYHVGILKKANLIKIVKDGYRTKCYISPV